MKLIRNSEKDYDNLFKNENYCFQEQQIIVFLTVFGIFCNLIIPKQGVEMPIFS